MKSIKYKTILYLIILSITLGNTGCAIFIKDPSVKEERAQRKEERQLMKQHSKDKKRHIRKQNRETKKMMRLTKKNATKYNKVIKHQGKNRRKCN